MHEFAGHHDKFVAAGATVIGVSLDDIARLKAFSADPQYCGGKVPVASDVDGRIATSYGMRITRLPFAIKDTRGATVDYGFAERTTFVVAQDGRSVATIGGVAPQENVAKALETVQKLAAKRAPK